MSLLETFQLALKNILGSKMRTFLTMLGIIIGVCAVIVIVGLGNGMQGYIESQFEDMGTDSLTVMIVGRGSSRSVSEEQMYEMVEENSDLLKQISPTAAMSSILKIGSDSITVQDKDQVTEAKTLVESELYAIFEDDDAYTVTSMAEMLDTMNEMVNVIIYVLAAIAAISLVVGGIGIMNIMLVSVTERTREIGIRKALGARESVIMRQFVIEAATTSSMGSILGILLGYGLSSVATVVIARIMPDTPITVSPSLLAVVVAFGVSTGIGIVFGYIPAKKAANLNPIDALHYD